MSCTTNTTTDNFFQSFIIFKVNKFVLHEDKLTRGFRSNSGLNQGYPYKGGRGRTAVGKYNLKFKYNR